MRMSTGCLALLLAPTLLNSGVGFLTREGIDGPISICTEDRHGIATGNYLPKFNDCCSTGPPAAAAMARCPRQSTRSPRSSPCPLFRGGKDSFVDCVGELAGGCPRERLVTGRARPLRIGRAPHRAARASARKPDGGRRRSRTSGAGPVRSWQCGRRGRSHGTAGRLGPRAIR